MANIKTVRFHNADTDARKGFVHAFDGMVTSLLAHQRKGDSIQIEMDDGSVVDYRFVKGKSHNKLPKDEGLEFHVEPGKVE
jgi:hypothetical protein